MTACRLRPLEMPICEDNKKNMTTQPEGDAVAEHAPKDERALVAANLLPQEGAGYERRATMPEHSRPDPEEDPQQEET